MKQRVLLDPKIFANSPVVKYSSDCFSILVIPFSFFYIQSFLLLTIGLPYTI